ncbi:MULTISPECIES: ABC transporter substrate-binding protein [unclassified Gordonia (in: high G+C Gram-positive bacteria)]|uniref:ABC transporter substrate-binding protein n=1 Tax=unclassified Gordonia (in: high G+C Gram-positive bacteria) TaxID=2657482 RepID=UPI001F0D1750|nr:ABC transporter substrate-binding protein [Gordonia sp. ABSL49_1]MCH5644767.1 ABC transporter substrate-binding protein [Gordonia sp. ABSL49_1]
MQMASKRSSRRQAGVLAAAAAVALLAVSGCSVANTTQSESASPNTLRIVLPQEPPTLEPCDASLTATGVVVRSNITEPLIERDPNSGTLLPKLASSWKQVEPNVWRFTMVDGVKFSNGAPFTAEDAAFSIKRTFNGAIGCDVNGYVFDDSKIEVTTPDAKTVELRTEAPDPILPLRVSFIEMVPRTTDAGDKVREPVGTGPYMVDFWDSGQRIVLKANPNYHGQAPQYTRAVYQWRTEGSVRAAMVANDEADIATQLGPEDGAGDLGIAYTNNETTALRMQGTDAPLNDFRVREAIDLSINRAGIVKALFQNLGTPAAQLVGKGIVGYNDTLTPTPYDLDRAKSLIDDARAAGVPVDRQIRLIGRTGQFPKINETIENIQYTLSKIGLDVKIEMMDTSGQMQYQTRPFVAGSGPVLLMIMHGNQAGDTQFTLDQYMLSDGYQSTFGTAAYDREIRAAEALTGPPRQAALAQVLANEPIQIRQYAYIAHMQAVLAKSKKVSYKPNSATGDEMRLAEMTHADSDND